MFHALLEDSHHVRSMAVLYIGHHSLWEQKQEVKVTQRPR